MKINKKIAAGAVLPAIAVGTFAGLSLSASPAHANNAGGVTHHVVAGADHHAAAVRRHPAASTTHRAATTARHRVTAPKATQHAAKGSADAAPAGQYRAGAEQTPTTTRQGRVTEPAMSGAESSFEKCVAWRESTDTPTDPDGLFGILPSTWQELGYSGSAGQASVALQKIAFNRLYGEYGTQPWAPSDGC